MRNWNRRRAVILFSAFLATAMVSTSLGQITVENLFSIGVTPSVPSVNLTEQGQHYAGMNVSLNNEGSQAYINVTGEFTFNIDTTLNLTNLLTVASNSNAEFAFLTNITDFTGQGKTQEVSLYSYNSSGTYFEDFNFTSTGQYLNNSEPISISPYGSSTFGLYISLGQADLGTHTWALDFEINGFFLSPDEAKAVFTQYLVNITVTTVEAA